MSTRCIRGGSTWPGPPRAVPNSTTSSRGCCRRWAYAPLSFTSIPATNAITTTIWTSANTHRALPYGVPKTTTLDIEVRTGGGAELADVDELLDAVRHGLLTPTVAEQAVRHAVDAVEGLARNGYDLTRWLATKGMELTWRSGS